MNYFVDLTAFENRELSHQECTAMLAAGTLTPQTLVCRADGDTWLPASAYFQRPAVPAAPTGESKSPSELQSERTAAAIDGTYLKYWLFILAALSAIVGVGLLSNQSYVAFGACLANAVILCWLGFILELLQQILNRLTRLVKLAKRKN